MLSERQLEELLKVFERRMQSVTDEYLRRMGEHIRDIGQLSPTDVHRLTQLKRVNANIEAIKREIASAADAGMQDIETVFRAAAESDQQFAETVYAEDHTPTVKTSPIKTLSSPLERILKAQLRVTAQEMANLSQTTLVSDAYRKAVDVAVQTVQSGLTDYTSAVRSALKEAAKEGLRVQYPSGLTRRVDTAVRQNVLDGVRALNQDVLQQIGKEYGADGVEISAHALCALDHLPYQGLQFTRKEFDRLQNMLRRPFGLWNCKHTVFPILMGISEPTHTREQLDNYRANSTEEITIGGVTKSRYEWTQAQRRIETSIREQKHIANAAKAAGDPVARREAQAIINRLDEEYAKISDAAGLYQKRERMTVAGFRRVSTLSPQQSRAVFRTEDDPMREVLGNAFASHPREVNHIIQLLEKSGIEVIYSKGRMAYSPGLRTGTPGQFIIDPDASYSAWLHEKKHADDDRSSGWNGMWLLINPETHARMENDAYDVEIDFARSLGYNEIVKRLEALKQKSIMEVLGNDD